MKWFNHIPQELQAKPLRSILILLIKLCFIILLPYLVTDGLVTYFAGANQKHLQEKESQYITHLLSEIANNSEPGQFFDSEFKNLTSLPFPSEAFNTRVQQIIKEYPEALSLHFYDHKGDAISLPYAVAKSRVVAKRFLECIKNPSLEEKYERFLQRFSGYSNAHRTLNNSPSSILILGASHDNKWGGWFQLQDENHEPTGELIVFISKAGVLKESPINNAIIKAQAKYGRNYKFAWQDPVNPQILLPEEHDFSDEAINTINNMPYGENLFVFEDCLGVKIFTSEGTAIVAHSRYKLEKDVLYFYIDSILGVICISIALLLSPVLLGISTFEAGIKLKITALILFGISLPLGLLAFTGIADRNEREQILTNKYELQNVEELKRIDESIISDYGDIENSFKNALNRALKAETAQNHNQVKDILCRIYSQNSYVKKIVYITEDRAIIYDENTPIGNTIKPEDDSVAHYGHSLIQILNGKYVETTEIGATDKNSVMQNMSGWMSRYVLLDSGKINVLNMLSNSSLTYTDFLFDSNYNAVATVFLFMNDYSLQNNYLYKISKLRDEELRRNPTGTKFAAIPTSYSSNWLSFPKRSTSKNETLAHLAKLASKSRIPAHAIETIGGTKYLITSIFGHNLYGFSLVLARPYNIIENEIKDLKKQLTFLLFTIAIVAIIASYFSTALLIKPIGTLKSGLEALSNGNFLTNLEDSNVKEFSLMLKTLNNTMYQLKELEVAKSVQETLLPLEGLRGSDWHLSGKSCSFTQLGGDHIEWLTLEDGRILIIIGDVTGHGIAPAMIQASIKVWLALNAEKATDSASLINTINQMHIAHGVRRFLMTAWVGYYKPSTGELEFSSAGHPFPILLTKDGKLEMLSGSGLPIGTTRKLRLKSQKIILEPESYLILYTDGFAEIENEKGEILGFDNFAEICSTVNGLNATEAIEAINKGIAQWGPQNDDQSLIILQRKAYETNK
jgi:serine phosphatase RsbU (regulator of sigma subunit)